MDATAKKTVEMIETFKGKITQSWMTNGFYAGPREYTLDKVVIEFSSCVRVFYKNKEIGHYNNGTPEYGAISKALLDTRYRDVELARREFLNKKL